MTDPFANHYPGQDCFAEHVVDFWRHQGAVRVARRSAAFLLRCARKNRGGVHLLHHSADHDGARLLVQRGLGAIETDKRGGWTGDDYFVANRYRRAA